MTVKFNNPLSSIHICLKIINKVSYQSILINNYSDYITIFTIPNSNELASLSFNPFCNKYTNCCKKSDKRLNPGNLDGNLSTTIPAI